MSENGGRNTTLDAIVESLDSPELIVEVGCGTCENLIRWRAMHPGAHILGFDAFEMLTPEDATDMGMEGFTPAIKYGDAVEKVKTYGIPLYWGFSRQTLAPALIEQENKGNKVNFGFIDGGLHLQTIFHDIMTLLEFSADGAQIVLANRGHPEIDYAYTAYMHIADWSALDNGLWLGKVLPPSMRVR